MTNADGSASIVTAGTLSLPGVTSYTHTAGTLANTATLRATGAGSVLDLPNVTTVTGGNGLNDQLWIRSEELRVGQEGRTRRMP